MGPQEQCMMRKENKDGVEVWGKGGGDYKKQNKTNQTNNKTLLGKQGYEKSRNHDTGNNVLLVLTILIHLLS